MHARVRRRAWSRGGASAAAADRAGAVHRAAARTGFHYIFDGTATGSDASFDKWTFASGHGRAVRRRRGPGPGDAGRRRGRDPRRRLAVRRLLVPGQAVRRRGVPHPVHGREHADVDAQRRRHDPHARLRVHGREHHRVSPRSRPASTTTSAPGALGVLQPHHAGRRRRRTSGRARPARSRRPPTPPRRRSSTPAATARARRRRASTTSTASTASR